MDCDRREKTSMRIASIDIGTNTCLLLLADIDESGNIHLVDHQQRFPRLGRHVDRSNFIQPAAFQEISSILNEYRVSAEKGKADRIIACATSAVRDAINKEEFLSAIHKSTGIMVEILSGTEEASLSYIGATSGLTRQSKPYAVLDIGGGSTEFSYPVDNLIRYESYQIGAVRITERFLSTQPPQKDELLEAAHFINHSFQSIEPHTFRDLSLLGVAGTATTLACLIQGLKTFDLAQVRGFSFSSSRVDNWLANLSMMNTDQILNLSDATTGRADILTAGVLILSVFMQRFGFNEITVSERGLRYGVALREWKRYREGHVS
jgi:exopolyphosphatase / guanosine-5'-triphosphate,3'-diphosphate pyrophosphatase